MQKTENLKSTNHKEKAHLIQRLTEPEKNTTKRHFIEKNKDKISNEITRPLRHR